MLVNKHNCYLYWLFGLYCSALYLMGENSASDGKHVYAEKLFFEAMDVQQHSLSLKHPERARSD